jgi:hypothetical protein
LLKYGRAHVAVLGHSNQILMGLPPQLAARPKRLFPFAPIEHRHDVLEGWKRAGLFD